jgi:hypothetical protein
MLKDPVLMKLDSTTDKVFRLIYNDIKSTRLETGVYLCPHGNFHLEIENPIEHFPNLDGFDNYGICDNFAQLRAVLPPLVTEDPDRFFTISLMEVRREDQPEDGGWRYHKWGEYIGTQKPRHEYLYDDKHIDSVICYHIIELIPTSEMEE